MNTSFVRTVVLHGLLLTAALCVLPVSSFAVKANTASSGNAPFTETPRTFTLSWPKPMGLIFEEVERPSSDSGGESTTTTTTRIELVGVQGAALEHNNNDMCCLKDVLVAIQQQDCRDWSLERVLDTIGSLEEVPVLTLEHPTTDSVTVRFRKTKKSIAARPGEHFCDLAFATGTPIEYECRNGVCGTCEQKMVVNGKTRYVRPCVSVVPTDEDEIALSRSDRFDVKP